MNNNLDDDYLMAAAARLNLPVHEADWPALRTAFAALAAQAAIVEAAAPPVEIEAAPRFVP